MSGGIRVLLVCGVLSVCWGPVAEQVFAAGGRFPRIERAVENVQQRVRMRAGFVGVSGPLTPQGDPYANQSLPGQTGPQNPLPADTAGQLPPYRPLFWWRGLPQLPSPQSWVAGRVPTPAPVRPWPDQAGPTLAPPRQAMSENGPTLAPPNAAVRQPMPSRADGPSATRQATSILVAPTPAPSQSGPREF